MIRLWQWFCGLFASKRKPLPAPPPGVKELYRRKFRWILNVEGLPEWAVCRCDGFIFPGGSSLKVEFYEAIDDPVSEKLLKWSENKETRPASLKFLDPMGDVIQEWVFRDFRLNISSFSDLDYSKCDPVVIGCSFIYSDVALKVSFEQ